MLAVKFITKGVGFFVCEVEEEARREARDRVKIVCRIRVIRAALVKRRVRDVHVALAVHLSVTKVISRAVRANTDIVSYLFDRAHELVRVACHQSTVGVLGHSEFRSICLLFSTHVVVLCLGDHLAIVSALLIFGWVGLVELVDDYISSEVGVALTELPRDLRFTTNQLLSVFTSHR